ncbi:UvrD-helicase domain-containing protein [Mesonia ostreae]|uniref:DNA 3'-5' helicase II n=1 Tax=Mesonia ostreae TaxID=861110 RepID=A0ABU2KFN9_9FLAO|nr:UvrD-helicase domain-containing protein [Mesonia ostreae]MDT0293523.1 UvrD-helicase domain-containing protein [Mesonia ostreae]
MGNVTKPKLVIAGPGAGKTHGMVDEIIHALKSLERHRYMIVVTYTNSATKNIKKRLGKRLAIPPNLFIGTIHSFLNRFIVIPYSSLHNEDVNGEKLFIQCGTDDVLKRMFDNSGETPDYKAKNYIKSRLTTSLHKSGYITYDQTLNLAKKAITNQRIKEMLANRIQYLYVDEFQDTGNKMFSIIESLRKEKKTIIYCVGDPEQYIQSFDSSIRNFQNIPILKASRMNQYETLLNKINRRSVNTIVTFLNNFSKRVYEDNTFEQQCHNEILGTPVKFISATQNITAMLPEFFARCENENISHKERGVIAKKNDVVNKAIAALNGNVLAPDKSAKVSAVSEIKDTLLSSLGTNQNAFCEEQGLTPFDLRIMAVQIIRAIRVEVITNENTFAAFVKDEFDLTIENDIPFKLDNLRQIIVSNTDAEAIMVSNIHRFKGLELDAVLAVAKNEAELNLWLETDTATRDAHSDKGTSDYPRLGYVAFSRARKILCIACLEPISDNTKEKLNHLGVEIDAPTLKFPSLI